eukprot:1195732-Prorocentrum_minimum.AAC.7
MACAWLKLSSSSRVAGAKFKGLSWGLGGVDRSGVTSDRTSSRTTTGTAEGLKPSWRWSSGRSGGRGVSDASSQGGSFRAPASSGAEAAGNSLLWQTVPPSPLPEP